VGALVPGIHIESPYVGAVVRDLKRMGHAVEIREVPYEFQRGGNRMMRVWKV